MSTRSRMSSDLGFIHKVVPAMRSEAPTLLLLHGTGGNEEDLIPLANMIDPDAAILSPRGKVLENGMPRFFRRIAEGKFDIEDLKFRTAELSDFVSQSSRKYGFDPTSVVAIGYSNGANIAASLLLLRPETLDRAILFRAMLPLQVEKSPDLSTKKVFISAGRFDTMIPTDGTIALEKALEEAGAKVTMNWVNSSHSLTQGEIETAREWLLK
jgi:phospholipase/carboxylesterase